MTRWLVIIACLVVGISCIGVGLHLKHKRFCDDLTETKTNQIREAMKELTDMCDKTAHSTLAIQLCWQNELVNYYVMINKMEQELQEAGCE